MNKVEIANSYAEGQPLAYTAGDKVCKSGSVLFAKESSIKYLAFFLNKLFISRKF